MKWPQAVISMLEGKTVSTTNLDVYPFKIWFKIDHNQLLVSSFCDNGFITASNLRSHHWLNHELNFEVYQLESQNQIKARKLREQAEKLFKQAQDLEQNI